MNRKTLCKFTVLAVSLLSTPTLYAAEGTPPPAPSEHPENIDIISAYATTEAPFDHAIGAQTAPHTLVVYASIVCPHCAHWFETEWPAIKSDLVETGELRVIFRELPTEPAALSMFGFQLAECAPPETYFNIIEYQMHKQGEILAAAQQGEARPFYEDIAQRSGLKDQSAMIACLEDVDHRQHVALSAARAQAAKITAVPAYFIHGQPYKGEASAKALSAFFKKTRPIPKTP